MKKHKLVLAIAVMAVAGCGGPAGNGSVSATDKEAAANMSGKATPEEEAEARVVRRPDAATAQTRLIGHWSRDVDCGRIVQFNPGGALVTFDGRPGRWSVGQGDRFAVLRMEGGGRVASLEVQLVADTEIQLREVGAAPDAMMAMRRCGGGPA